jgi:hypothetical protein
MSENELKLGASVNPRCRISAWADPTVFMNGKKVTKQVTGADGKVSTVTFFQPDMKNLFKTDALVKEVLAGRISPDQKLGFRVLDDISLLVTFFDDNTPKMNVVWDSSMLQGASNDIRRQFFQQVIAHCHDVLGVQCLVGYARATAGGSQFDKWLKMKTPVPSIDEFTDAIVKFCEANLTGFDGISFDIEGLTPNAGSFETVKKNLVEFYQTLARKLRSPPFVSKTLPQPANFNAGYDRIVAFAAGTLIGPVKDPPTAQQPIPKSDGKMKKSRLLKHEDNNPDQPLLEESNDYVSKTKALDADLAFQVHDYDAAHGDRNLLVRPMAYDNFLSSDPTVFLDDWHADICRYVSKVLNLHPGNFQLGVKTILGPGQSDRPNPNKPGEIFKGMDGVMGGNSATQPQRIEHVKRRCRDLLSPYKHGLAFFPTSADFWKEANDALNPSIPEAGRLVDQPIQCPLNKAALAILNKKPKPARP